MWKQILTVIAILIFCCPMVQAADANGTDSYMTLWLSGSNLAYQNTSIDALLGYRWRLDEHFDLELGPALSWRTWTEADNQDDTQSSLGLGAFAAIHAVDLISIPNPLAQDVPWMPAEIAGEPYFILPYIMDTEGKGTTIAPGIGTRVFDLFAVQTSYVMTQGERVEDDWRVGISAKFEL